MEGGMINGHLDRNNNLTIPRGNGYLKVPHVAMLSFHAVLLPSTWSK